MYTLNFNRYYLLKFSTYKYSTCELAAAAGSHAADMRCTVRIPGYTAAAARRTKFKFSTQVQLYVRILVLNLVQLYSCITICTKFSPSKKFQGCFVRKGS
jgi:hypothetical protein